MFESGECLDREKTGDILGVVVHGVTVGQARVVRTEAGVDLVTSSNMSVFVSSSLASLSECCFLFSEMLERGVAGPVLRKAKEGGQPPCRAAMFFVGFLYPS